jgi:sigma-B regulation protein RsbU (phosphoserine phosphatase)
MTLDCDGTAAPSTTSSEERRQRAVESLGVLDAGPTERLDRITRLARAIFEVPLSSISILD